MITENEVIDAVCNHLTLHGYTVSQRRQHRQPGDDIIASSPSGIVLHVEAKGGTSGFATSARFGKPFDSAQCQVHVAEAFFRAVAMHEAAPTGQTRRVAIALPASELHDAILSRVSDTTRQLEIGVFRVHPDRSVILTASWTL